MVSDGDVVAYAGCFQMQRNLFSGVYNTHDMLIPPDRYLFPDQREWHGIVVVLKMNMAVGSNFSDTPVEKGKGRIRQWLQRDFFFLLKYLKWDFSCCPMYPFIRVVVHPVSQLPF